MVGTNGLRQFDVFVSYAREDGRWVRALAGRLHLAGLEVFLDEWELGAGDVVVRSLEEGIRSSLSGILVFSRLSLESPWVMEEYAALLGRAVTGGHRFIPVLFEDVELPVFAASRLWVDFRGADGPEYEARVAELVRAVRGLPSGERPERGGPAPGVPGGRLRPEGARRVRLTVAADEVAVFDQDQGDRVAGVPDGAAVQRLPARLNELSRLRRSHGPSVVRGPGAGVTDPVESALRDTGVLLGEAFAAGPVGSALAGLIDDARGHGAGLRLAMHLDGGVAEWPWETLVPPGGDRPLALADAVQPYRTVDPEATVPAVAIPGPLRILVVLASPDGAEGGPLLDVEHELATILDAVEPARKHLRAHVRVLNLGTLAAIRDALALERTHILHICCHAEPGRLVLENERGGRHAVSAQDLIGVLPEQRRPALVVLAGCSTALSRVADDSVEALLGLARGLLAAGVPQVVAMTAAVTDLYAAAFAGRLYRELAVAAEPMVVDAVARARRQVEADRQALPEGHPYKGLVEWATPVVFVRGEPLPLYDPAAPPGPVVEVPEPVLPAGVPLRPVGDFVGRRADLRALLATLRRGDHAGVVIHGIGGVGKSSLAAEILRLLGEDAGLVVPLVGAVSVDQILAAFGHELFVRAMGEGLPDTHPWRELGRYLRAPGEAWQERLAAAFGVLAGHPVTLLIDNFETNLDERADSPAVIRDKTLAEFLAAWSGSRGMHRLLITSRFPFTLPPAERRLVWHHLGPLSLAETRKLIWRLPGLDALTPAQQQRAWTDVGGHPRTLEYLDALLRKGRARFDDVTTRLERLLAEQGIAAPDRWITQLHDDPQEDDAGRAPDDGLIGRALAEAITLTVNDTLLDKLLALLDDATRDLLVGAAVYRQPVAELALAWQTSAPAPVPADPDRLRRLAEFGRRLKAASAEARSSRDPAALGYTDEQMSQLRADVRATGRPPLAEPTVDVAMLDSLCTLGLLTPITGTDSEPPRYAIHRWTAAALGRLYPDATTTAHQRAAAYYSWRFRHHPQDVYADLDDRIEARYHHHASGDLDAAVSLTYAIRDQLETWSAWDWEISICQETLTWLPPGTYDAAAFNHQLGILAQARGNYPEAARRYEQSLAIFEELDDEVGSASSFGQLGTLAYLVGEFHEAERRYLQALRIFDESGNRAGAANSHHQLGMLAQDRGDFAEAERRYLIALGTFEELGDRAGAANSHHQLGMLAQDRGDFAEAERRYLNALDTFEKQGNLARAATTYHQLGMLAQDRTDYVEAARRYEQALTIKEALGNRASAANSYGQLGVLAQHQGDYAEAERRYRQAMSIFDELGNRIGMGTTLSQLGNLRAETGRLDEAVALHCLALSIRVGLGVAQASNNAATLRSLRSTLGDKAFADAASTVLDEESLQNLIAALVETGEEQS